MPSCLIGRFPVLQEIPRRTRFLASCAFGALAESHAPLRREDGVSRRTIRRTPSTWCLSPGEHVSDETAHTPSLSQRDPAVLQHRVRRFAVASDAEQLLHLTERSIPGAWTRDCKVILGPWRSRYLGLCPPRRETLDTFKATLQQNWWATSKNSSWSPFVSSQGVVSPGSSMDRICTRTKGTESGVRRKSADCTTSEGKASRRSDRHCHLPLVAGGARSAFEHQGVHVQVFQESPDSSTAGFQSQYIVARITSKQEEGERGNHGQRKLLIPKGNRVAGMPNR